VTASPNPPRSAQALLELVLPVDVRESIAGDLDELFQRDCRRHGVRRARLRYSRQALSFAVRFTVERCVDWRRETMMRTRLSGMDMKLGLRMLIKYPGLTMAGGFALALAIGVGAGWYEVSRDLFRPSIPLPEGDRIVEIEMRDARGGGERERRLLHDFLIWRRDLPSVEQLGAYRTLERLLAVGQGDPRIGNCR
jgi:hypothetical protein